MNHLAAVQLIAELASLESESPDRQCDWLPLPPSGIPDTRWDRMLAAALIAVQPALSVVMRNYPVEHCTEVTEVPKLEKLMSKCQEVPPILYTADTRFDFHRLLVATLVGYTKSLQALYRAAQDGLSLDDMQQAGHSHSIRSTSPYHFEF